MEDKTKPQKSKLAQRAEKVQDAADKLSKAYRTLFILWNLLYIVAYSVFIVITMSRKNAEIVWLPYLLIAFTAAYFVAFVAMICMGRSNAKLGSAVKDYKSSFKIMKLCLKLFNLLLTISVVFNAVYNDRSLFSIILTAVSIPYVIIQIILSIRKIVKRKRKEKLKEKKSGLRKGLLDDVKNILTDGDPKREAAASVQTGQSTEQPSPQVPAAPTEAAPPAQTEQKAPKKGLSAKLDETRKKAAAKMDAVKQAAGKGGKVLDRVKQYRKDVKEVEESSKKKKKDESKK